MGFHSILSKRTFLLDNTTGFHSILSKRTSLLDSSTGFHSILSKRAFLLDSSTGFHSILSKRTSLLDSFSGFHSILSKRAFLLDSSTGFHSILSKRAFLLDSSTGFHPVLSKSKELRTLFNNCQPLHHHNSTKKERSKSLLITQTYPTSYIPVGTAGSVSCNSTFIPRSCKIFPTDMRARSFILLSLLKCAK
jgi:hypothetical protein